MEWKGPGAVGDQSPWETCSSWDSFWLESLLAVFGEGELGREGYGEPEGKGDWDMGESVKR